MCPSPHGYGPMGSTPNTYPQDRQLISARPCRMRDAYKLQHIQVSTGVGLLVFYRVHHRVWLTDPLEMLIMLALLFGANKPATMQASKT